MTMCLRLALYIPLIAIVIQPARAQDAVVLDTYTCSQFLKDTSDPADGERLLRSLMMIAWATGYAAAHQGDAPRGDPKAIQMIAATLGDECRKQPQKLAIPAIVDAVQKFASAKQVSIAKTLGPLAIGQSRWEQDGSIIYLVADGASRKFYFERPRNVLTKAGIKKGALLFDGKKDGNHYTGTAYTYVAKCKPMGFQVIGDISGDEKQVTLHGKLPKRTSACKVTGYSDENLVLTFIPPEEK